MNDLKRIGRTVVKIRAEQTQEEFAAEIGVSTAYLSKIENGVQPMGRKTAFRLSKYSGLSIENFLVD